MNRRIFPAIVFAMLGALLWPPQAQAQLVHYVDNVETCRRLVPCYPTIMDAVNAAVPFDAIEVFPGVYHESVVFDGTKSDIILRARFATLPPVIAAPPSAYAAVVITHTAGVQVLDLILEGGVDVATLQRDVMIMRNFVRGGIRHLLGTRCTVSKNVILDGSILVDNSSDCVVEKNTVIGGEIVLTATRGGPTTGNIIRHNVVRRGGIVLAGTEDTLVSNTVEANFVSGGSGIGITSPHGDQNGHIFRGNTSVENMPCDIYDFVTNGPPSINTWKNNRFFTKCVFASD